MIVITQHEILDDFAQALCVDDDDLDKIIKNVCLMHDNCFIMSMLDKKGENAVIVRLELVNRHSVGNHIERLLKRFKSVSWVRNGKFYTRRRK